MKEINNQKIKLLVESGIRTNIHFILDNISINDAIELLEGKFNDLLNGVNGMIFLTYKPKGRGKSDKCLVIDERIEKFLDLIDENNINIRIGFDACFVPMLIKNTSINVDYVDSCECGFFSVYIDEELNVKPCSFANDDRFVYNLKEFKFEDIWINKYEDYRKYTMKNNCKNNCVNKNQCRGKCAYYKEITLCYV